MNSGVTGSASASGGQSSSQISEIESRKPPPLNRCKLRQAPEQSLRQNRSTDLINNPFPFEVDFPPLLHRVSPLGPPVGSQSRNSMLM